MTWQKFHFSIFCQKKTGKRIRNEIIFYARLVYMKFQSIWQKKKIVRTTEKTKRNMWCARQHQDASMQLTFFFIVLFFNFAFIFYNWFNNSCPVFCFCIYYYFLWSNRINTKYIFRCFQFCWTHFILFLIYKDDALFAGYILLIHAVYFFCQYSMFKVQQIGIFAIITVNLTIPAFSCYCADFFVIFFFHWKFQIQG